MKYNNNYSTKQQNINKNVKQKFQQKQKLIHKNQAGQNDILMIQDDQQSHQDNTDTKHPVPHKSVPERSPNLLPQSFNLHQATKKYRHRITLLIGMSIIFLQLAWIINSNQLLQKYTEQIAEGQQLLTELQQRNQKIDRLFEFRHHQLVGSRYSREIDMLLRGTFYDAHFFISSKEPACIHEKPRVLMEAGNFSQFQFQETKLQITKSNQQLEQIIQNMIYHKHRPAVYPDVLAVNRVSKRSRDLAYFFYSLDQQPQNNDYLQAQYYRYNKLYNISKYYIELPLCITLIGRNNAANLAKLYKTITQQNYSNYHIVHIDDNSNDMTPNLLETLIQEQYPQLVNRITIVSQNRRRNQLSNRDYAIRKYCREDDIVLDMDADDWIIGRQVFKLVNALYQAKNIYRQDYHTVWALYLNHIVYSTHCGCILPNVDGQISQKQIKYHTYRAEGHWRTTQLRSFRRKLYMKINTTDFIDYETDRKEFYTEASDAFMHAAIFELAGPKHTKIVDQFPYFYSLSKDRSYERDSSLDFFYSVYKQQTITPYKYLQSLDQKPTKVRNYKISFKQFIRREIKTWEIRERRNYYRRQIEKILGKHNVLIQGNSGLVG